MYYSCVFCIYSCYNLSMSLRGFRRFSTFVIFVFAFSLSSGAFSFAEGEDDSIEVEAAVLPVLSISAPDRARVNVSPGGPASQARIPFTFSSNNSYGFYFSITTNTPASSVDDYRANSLINEYDSSFVFRPISEDVESLAAFEDNTWGCSMSDETNYHALPALGGTGFDGIYSGPIVNNGRYLDCAAKASKFQAAGDYSTTILFRMTSNVVPDTILSINFMQQVDDVVIASMEEGRSYQLADGRDGKIYWVTKMQDGRVWMTQNLDYDLKKNGVYLSDWGRLYPENEDAYANSNDVLYKDGGNYYYDTETGSLKDASVLAFNDEKTHYKIGSFYNITTAGRNSSDYSYVSNLCPFGWTLQDSSLSVRSYGSNLLPSLSNFYNHDLSETMYFVPMGFIDSNGELSGVGTKSYYLVDDAENVDFDSMPDTSGGFVRCVSAKPYTYTIYYRNYYHPEDVTDLVTKSVYSSNSSETMQVDVPNPSFYDATFIGWGNYLNLTADTYTYGDTVSFSDSYNRKESSEGSNAGGTTYLYAIFDKTFTQPESTYEHENYNGFGTISDATYMQDVTPEVVSNSLVNETATLIDARDGKEYIVKKLSDENVWMMRNLDLDLSAERTLTPADSNVSIDRTLVKDGSNIIQNHETAGDDYNINFGSRYNYPAAFAGSVSGSLTPFSEISESICPKGWVLPSFNNRSRVFLGDVPNREVFDGSVSGYNSSSFNVYVASVATSTVAANGKVRRYGFNDTISSEFDVYVRCVAAAKPTSSKTILDIEYMQEMKPEICSASSIGSSAKLTDKRDGIKYIVRKTDDGNCWMMQNLNYDANKSNSNYNISFYNYYDPGSVLSANTDFDLIDGAASSPNYVSFRVYRQSTAYDSDQTNASFANNSLIYLPNRTFFNDFYDESSAFKVASVGGVYSFGMATMRTYKNNSDASSSVCPRGWRLPTADDPIIPDVDFSRLTIGLSSDGRYAKEDELYITSTMRNNMPCYAGVSGAICNSGQNLHRVRCLAR